MSLGEFLFFVIYLALQVLIPLRRLVRTYLLGSQKYVMSSSGDTFSWTMKLRSVMGSVKLYVYDRKTGKKLRTVRPKDYLDYGHAIFVMTQPRAVIQFAHYVQKKLKEEGIEDVAIYAYCATSINDRGLQVRIDPKVDLTREKLQPFGHYPWYINC